MRGSSWHMPKESPCLNSRGPILALSTVSGAYCFVQSLNCENNVGAFIIRISFEVHSTMIRIRSPQNSIGRYFRPIYWSELQASWQTSGRTFGALEAFDSLDPETPEPWILAWDLWAEIAALLLARKVCQQDQAQTPHSPTCNTQGSTYSLHCSSFFWVNQ